MGEVVTIDPMRFSPEPTTKRCPQCLEIKPLDSFRTAKRKVNCYCRPCKRSQPSHKAALSKRARWGQIAVSARRRAAQQGVPSKLTAATVRNLFESQGGKCALTGMPLTHGKMMAGPYSPSLDRIYPERGYVPGNVRFICNAINSFKGRMTDAEMLVIATAMVAMAKKRVKKRSI